MVNTSPISTKWNAEEKFLVTKSDDYIDIKNINGIFDLFYEALIRTRKNHYWTVFGDNVVQFFEYLFYMRNIIVSLSSFLSLICLILFFRAELRGDHHSMTVLNGATKSCTTFTLLSVTDEDRPRSPDPRDSACQCTNICANSITRLDWLFAFPELVVNLAKIRKGFFDD